MNKQKIQSTQVKDNYIYPILMMLISNFRYDRRLRSLSRDRRRGRRSRSRDRKKDEKPEDKFKGSLSEGMALHQSDDEE